MVSHGKPARDYAAAMILAAGFTAGAAGAAAAPLPAHPAAFAAAAVALALAIARPSSLAMGACGLCCGLLSSWTPAVKAAGNWPSSIYGVFTGTVAARSEDAWGRDQILVKTCPGLGGDRPRPFPVLLSLEGAGPPEPGDAVRFFSRLRFKPSGGASEPFYLGTVRPGGWARVERRGLAELFYGMRRRVSATACREGPAAGVYRSLLLGEQSSIPWDCMRAFRRTGTSHLLAISGLNLAAAIALGALLGFPVAALMGRRNRPLLSVSLRFVFGLGAAGMYLSLCGLSSSASRALVWAVLAGLAPALGRRSDPIVGASLCLAVLGVLSTEPQPDLSLTLSLLAFVAVVRCLHREDGILTRAVRITLGACLYTAPVTVWVFGSVPTLSFIFNLVAGPPFSLLLIPGALLGGVASIVHPLAGSWWLTAWETAARPVLALLSWGADLPGACVTLNAAGRWAGALASLVVVLIWERRGRPILVGVLLWALAAGAALGFCTAQRMADWTRLSVCFPAMGQADAAIIRAGGKTILVDSGPPGPPWREPPILTVLRREGIATIDLLVLTHGHPDHTGGAGAVLRALDVARVLVPRSGAGEPGWPEPIMNGHPGSTWLETAQGDVHAVGELSLRIHHPPPDGRCAEGNEGSLVVEALWRGRSVLLAGDAPWEAVGRTLAAAGEPDILKIPHHGSGVGFDARGWSPALRRLADRGTVVVCTARPSGARLPADEVRQAFGRFGLDLRFPADGNGIWFRYRARGDRRHET